MRKIVCSCSANSQEANTWTRSTHLEMLLCHGSTKVPSTRSHGARARLPARLHPHSLPAPWLPQPDRQVSQLTLLLAKQILPFCLRFQGPKSSFPENRKPLHLKPAFTLSPAAPSARNCTWPHPSNKITNNQCEKQAKALGEENSAALQHFAPQLTIPSALHCVDRITLQF